MTRDEIKIGMQVKKLTSGGPTGSYIKEPTYIITEIYSTETVEYTVKGGKRWTCHCSWLVPANTPSGPVEAVAQ